jgi:hypothetical protein
MVSNHRWCYLMSYTISDIEIFLAFGQWALCACTSLTFNVDHGDLEHIKMPGFTAKKRIVHSEETVNKAIFMQSWKEVIDTENVFTLLWLEPWLSLKIQREGKGAPR